MEHPILTILLERDREVLCLGQLVVGVFGV
jgi:hypothetical protein